MEVGATSTTTTSPPSAMSSHSYDKIASSFELWQEYVDPDATTSEEEFDAMGYAGRMALMVETYGPEPDQAPTGDEVLVDAIA
jgi:hypothetical protein